VDVKTELTRDANGLEVLSAVECLQLLRTQVIGRIGLSAGALPVVLPVHFAIVGDEIMISARQGTTLDAATRQAIVAFEADQLDAHTGAGWSVMVQGIARRTADPELPPTAQQALERWLDRHHSHVVTVSIDFISGRRIEALSTDGPTA
jgi:nitroimidazol reductase NimA-like FMN-containing flavoprotein (pyridoxamine 5'-phosphate oxidase superfamily)